MQFTPLSKFVKITIIFLVGTVGLRTCTLCLLGFSEFFRYSELSNILMKYLEFFYTRLEINIQKSKTDIYRRGNTMVIAKKKIKLADFM
jgi:hypothetical protein